MGRKTEFNLPETVKDAIIKKTLSDDTIKEILRIRDPLILSKIAVIIKRKNRYEKNIIKTAQFSEKRRQLMKEKMSEYRKVKSRGLILSSIWDIGKRDNYAGDPQFYGNTPTQVIEQCVIRLTKPNDVILDAMAGSGTTIDVCKVLNRTAIAYDLNPTRSDITKNDSRNIPLGDSTIDMGFLHPPYLNMVKYYNSKATQDELPKFIAQIIFDTGMIDPNVSTEMNISIIDKDGIRELNKKDIDELVETWDELNLKTILKES